MTAKDDMGEEQKRTRGANLSAREVNLYKNLHEAQGFSFAEIAKMATLPKSTVSSAIYRARKLHAEPQGVWTRVPKLNKDQHLPLLQQWLKEDCQQTQKQLLQRLKEADPSFNASQSLLSRRLREWGFRLKAITQSPIGRNTPRVIDQREVFAKEKAALLTASKPNVLFLDQSRIQMESVRKRGYAFGNEPAVAKVRALKPRSISFFGALSVNGIEHMALNRKTNNAQHTIDFLSGLFEKRRALTTEKCYIVWDNAKIHTAKKVSEFMEKPENKQFELIFLPPYSCQLNAIERYWHELKSHLRGTKYNTWEAFEKAVKRCVKQLNGERVERFSKYVDKAFEYFTPCLNREEIHV